MDSDHAAGNIKHMDWDIGPPSPRYDEDRDHVVVLRGVSWEQYEEICDARDKRPRMAFLDGALELMTTSKRHELAKTLIARLLEMFAVECDVALTGAGETTWRNKRRKAAAEADECYFIGPHEDRPPDLALEVVFTSGGVDKLEIYRRLGVREVWFWIDGRFWLYALADGKYQEVRSSRVLPRFDLDEIARILLTIDDDDDQTSIVRAYRDALRTRQ
jgi:Uma2 family endonuclease